MIGVEGHWPSLADEVDLAGRLFGAVGPRRVADWLDQKVALVDNSDFANDFAAHVNLPGIAALDYAHRLVRTRHGELLAGIRFYADNVERPEPVQMPSSIPRGFVDIVAHTFTDRIALADCVASEWVKFSVSHLRLCRRPGSLAGEDVVLDGTVHVARYNQMTPHDGRVRLVSLPDSDDAIRIVADRYTELAASQPELANNVSPQDRDDLEQFQRSNQLQGIEVGDTVVGVIAIAPGEIRWITGDEIQEEVISTPYLGHGYASSAQTAWSSRATNPETLLIGTIDRHNHASRRTALRAGRPAVLEEVFVKLHRRMT